MSRVVQPCPSAAAYRRHFDHGEVPCAGCRRANADYSRATAAARRKRRSIAGPTFWVPAALPGEVWRAVPSASGYEASNLGRVRSVDREVVRVDGIVQRWPGRVLSQHVHRVSGRHTVFCGQGKRRLVHHLVLEAFIGPRPAGLVGCHRDDNSSNNALANLRWDTQTENALDVVRNGNHELVNRKRCPRGHDLVVPNLSTGAMKLGRRSCKACHRARARLQYQATKGITGDLQAVSDAYYTNIMEAA